MNQAFLVKDDHYITSTIPYGEYILQVRRPGFRTHEQSLRIYQSRLSVRVFLHLAQITNETLTEVIGTVTPVPAKAGKLWVKMLPLLATESIGEAEIESDGRFRITGLDEGEYVLVVMQGRESIYMKQIRLHGVMKTTVALP